MSHFASCHPDLCAGAAGRDVPLVSHHLWHRWAPPSYEKLMLTPDLCTIVFNSSAGFIQIRHGQMIIFLSNQPELWYRVYASSVLLCQIDANCGKTDNAWYGIKYKWGRQMIPDPAKSLQEQSWLISIFWTHLRGQNEFLLDLHFVSLWLW